MRPHSIHGGRHELGQNFLHSRTTIDTITSLTRTTSGSILEIGPGHGALTKELYKLERPLTLVELDETRIDHLEHTFPRAQVVHADVLSARIDHPVVVGNLPFHLTTPIMRKLLGAPRWQHAILLTQWEVARKRAGVGGSTMMTAQWSPWFDFRLIGRVPARHFSPRPSVDGGILMIERDQSGLLPPTRRRDYQKFVRQAFTGRGRGMKGILLSMKTTDKRTIQSALDRNGIGGTTLPKDLNKSQWVGLYSAVNPDAPSNQTKRLNTQGKKDTMPKNNQRNSKKQSDSASGILGDGALGAIPGVTGEVPTVAEKPVVTGEIPIVGVETPAKGLGAPLQGLDAKSKSHDKAHLQAERGFMPQHKKAQPQPRWNLPRR